jgi:pyrimidine operon attenuation protein / uracil phosphoribosyltransferase
MKQQRTLVLDEASIAAKIKRIAYQILENNYDEKEIIFIGIKDNGVDFANRLIKYLQTISNISYQTASIHINKLKPLSEEIILDIEGKLINNKVVILVDDVANSGKTICFALKPLLNFQPKKIQVAVLVDRKHKSYPISCDYIGLSLSTTMKEHILVEFEKKKEAVYLV